jgi:hypothetical protein
MGLAFDLLAHCCGLARGIPPKTSMAAQSACAVLDEERFIALARQHKVAGTAYAGLAKAGISLSQDGMHSLAREAMVGHATRSLLLRDWREIVAAFKAEGIRALTIKGPASSIQLYGDALTREYYDLDILADIEDIRPVLPVMAGLGYELSDTLPLPSTIQTSPFVQKDSHHVNFQKRDGHSMSKSMARPGRKTRRFLLASWRSSWTGRFRWKRPKNGAIRLLWLIMFCS